MSEEDLKSYIKGYYLDRKMTYTKLDKHDRAIGVLLEENKQLKEKIDILLEDNNQLEEIRIKTIEYIKGHTDKLKTIRVPKIDFDYSELLEILGDKENDI